MLEECFATAPPWLRDRVILLGYKGSIAYGTATKESDIDLQGVAVPHVEHFFGLEQFEQFHAPEGSPADLDVFSLRRFVNLALQANPNILELLWLKPEHYLVRTRLGKELCGLRHDVLSRRVYRTFCGYALAQLQKMRQRNGKPNHGKGDCARQESIEKFGYCTKNALHLVRLMRMGIEVLKTGELTVHRPDSDDLLAIRAGKYTLEELIQMHSELYDEMNRALEMSVLPVEPNYRTVNRALVELTRAALSDNADESGWWWGDADDVRVTGVR